MSAHLDISRRLFSTDEYHRMGKAGILATDDRVELIEGELVQMATIGGPHLNIVNVLNTLFAGQVYGRAVVSIQNPISLPPHSEPQPDLALLKWDLFKNPVTPVASDVLLVVEVADITRAYDRDVKMRLCAQHAIVEAWLFDVDARIMLIHREPTASGYRDVTSAAAGDTISPVLLPDVKIAIADLP